VAANVIFVGDQNPSLPAIVKDASGNVIDLTGYLAVTFALAIAYDSVATVRAVGVFVNPRTAGTIRYDWGASDLTGLTPGRFVGQWILNDASNKPQHVPAGLFDVQVGY
jgi:hypothetical protein